LIGHDHRCLEIELAFVVMQAAIEDSLPDSLRQYPSTTGAERNEVRLVIAL
jgi:hypothetical protein